MAYSTSAPIGTMDADVLVTLNPGHRPTDDYVHELRRILPREFPGVSFYFLPADIVSQILNFGLPAPIDIQLSGPNVEANHAFATNLLGQLRGHTWPPSICACISFSISLGFRVAVNRTKAMESGFTQLDVANNLLVSLSGSFQTTPSFWLDPKTGVTYSVVTQTPQYAASSLERISKISPSRKEIAHRPEILATSVSTTPDAVGMALVSHYNLQRSIDIFGSVQDRDLGGVASRYQSHRGRESFQASSCGERSSKFGGDRSRPCGHLFRDCYPGCCSRWYSSIS